MAPPKFGSGKRGVINSATVRDLVKFTIRAAPVPREILQFLQDNLAILRQMERDKSSKINDQISAAAEDNTEEEVDLQGELIKRPTIKPDEFWPILVSICDKMGSEWGNIKERLIAFGPQRAGTCLLLDARNNGVSDS